MSLIPKANFDYGQSGNISSVNAVLPLVYDPNTNNLSVNTASTTNTGIVSTSAQTFGGKKTFANGLSSSVAPSGSSDVVTKSYVDNLVTLGNTWIAPILNISTFPISSPHLNDRYIASNTTGSFTQNNIYQYNGSAWVESVPSDGYTCFNEATNMIIIYVPGSGWINANNSIFNQSLNTTDSPTFGGLTITGNASFANGISINGGLTVQYPIYQSDASGINNVFGDNIQCPSITTTGDVTFGGAINVVNPINQTGDPADVNTFNGPITTPSLSTTGGTIYQTGSTDQTNTFQSPVSLNSDLNVGGTLNAGTLNAGTLGISSFTASSPCSITATTPSSSTNSGAFTVAGGLGAQGIFTSTLSVVSTTASTTTSTGALIVKGGCGIGGNLYVGNLNGYTFTRFASTFKVTGPITTNPTINYVAIQMGGMVHLVVSSYSTSSATVNTYFTLTDSSNTLPCSSNSSGVSGISKTTVGGISTIGSWGTINTSQPFGINIYAGVTGNTFGTTGTIGFDKFNVMYYL